MIFVLPKNRKTYRFFKVWRSFPDETTQRFQVNAVIFQMPPELAPIQSTFSRKKRGALADATPAEGR
jgi:hypothetical protein